MKEIIISIDKSKLILLLLAGMGFTYISFWFIFKPSQYVNFISRSEINVFIVGILGILLFGICSIYLIIKLFDNKPGLIINEKGIIDNTNSNSLGLILWSDIVMISPIKVASTRLLLVKLKKPEKYIERVNQINKLILRKNIKTYGTPITLTSVILKCSFEELERLILESFNQSKKI